MLRTKIKSLIASLLCVMTLFIGGFSIKAYANSTPSSVQQIQQVQEYDVLLYHSHTHEAYSDSNVVEMGNDLASKLEKKGLRVKVINDVFDSNYNNSYYSSREMLKTELQKSRYKLIIDMHRDSIAQDKKVVGTDHNGNETSKVMFVTTYESKNYQENKKTVDELKNSIDKFGNGMTRDTWKYRKGISYYNSDLGNTNGNGNVILIEQGFQTNDSLSVKRANTYLAASIEQYINNNFK